MNNQWALLVDQLFPTLVTRVRDSWCGFVCRTHLKTRPVNKKKSVLKKRCQTNGLDLALPSTAGQCQAVPGPAHWFSIFAHWLPMQIPLVPVGARWCPLVTNADPPAHLPTYRPTYLPTYQPTYLPNLPT